MKETHIYQLVEDLRESGMDMTADDLESVADQCVAAESALEDADRRIEALEKVIREAVSVLSRST